MPLPTWARKSKDTDTMMDDSPRTLQVTVMIAMPEPELSRRPEIGDEEPKLGAYQIGVARIPWEGQDIRS
jgi:hypothetical protein